MKKQKISKWDIIDRLKYYPPIDAREFDVEEFMPTMKVVEYQKNNIVLYYFRHGTIFFMPANWDMEWGGIYKVFECVLKTIKINAPKNKTLGFELSELTQLNKIVQYMIERNGYKTCIENGFLIVIQ